MTVNYLIIKEFKQFLRNLLLPIVCFILPLALMNIVPRIATQEITGLNFAVVDNDHSTTTRRLIQKIDASRYLSLVRVADTYDQAMESVENGDADLILEFQPHFERDMLKTGTASLMLSANATNGTKGTMAQSYITQIIQSMDVPVSVRFLYNQRLDYKIYMIPAVFALMLILVVGFLPALNIVGEKERGTIEQINVTPVGKVEFIISKVVPYVCIGMIMVAEGLFAAKGLYGIVPAGSTSGNIMPVVRIYTVCIVFCALVSSLGLIVSNYASTIQQAALTMFFFLVIFIIMSGLLTPVTSMPEWARALTEVNPMRFLIEALRAIYVKGATIAQISTPLTRLSVMAVVAWIWAIASYRKSA